MAFHLHLINSPCDCVTAGQLNFFRGAAAGSSENGRPVLAWTADADGQLTARWTMARD